MADGGLVRDVRKSRNKLELKLDSQQVFFLFAGLAAYTAAVFILGIVVGKSRRSDLAKVQSPVALAMELPTTSSITDFLHEGDIEGGSEDTIYQLGQPGNPNSIAAAIPNVVKKPVRKSRGEISRKSEDAAGLVRLCKLIG